jgi:hypothetical protein
MSCLLSLYCVWSGRTRLSWIDQKKARIEQYVTSNIFAAAQHLSSVTRIYRGQVARQQQIAVHLRLDVAAVKRDKVCCCGQTQRRVHNMLKIHVIETQKKKVRDCITRGLLYFVVWIRAVAPGEEWFEGVRPTQQAGGTICRILYLCICFLVNSPRDSNSHTWHDR